MILARCPEVVGDDYGGAGCCKAAAEVVASYLFEADTSEGTVLVLHARVHCDAGHRLTVLWEDLDLLTD